MKNLQELSKYDTFIYDHYEIEDLKNSIKITYYFDIPNLEKFTPTIEIPKKEEKSVLATNAIYKNFICLLWVQNRPKRANCLANFWGRQRCACTCCFGKQIKRRRKYVGTYARKA